MNLRVFYLTRRGLSDGYQRRKSHLHLNLTIITQKSPPTQYLLDIAWRGFYGLCITDCGTEATIV